MSKEKHSNKQKKMYCKLKGIKGKNNPKLEEAVKLSKTWFFKCFKSLSTVLEISLTIWHLLCLPGSFGVVLLSRSLNWFSPSFTNTTSLWKVLLTRPDYFVCHLWFVSLSFCITSRFSYLLIGSANWQQILLNDIGLWVEQKDVGRHFNKFVAKK